MISADIIKGVLFRVIHFRGFASLPPVSCNVRETLDPQNSSQSSINFPARFIEDMPFAFYRLPLRPCYPCSFYSLLPSSPFPQRKFYVLPTLRIDVVRDNQWAVLCCAKTSFYRIVQWGSNDISKGEAYGYRG